MEDKDFQYCKMCLVTDVKMFRLNTPSLLEAYSRLIEVVIVCGDYQMYVCYECGNLLQKYIEFRLKSVKAFTVVSSINTDHSKVSKDIIKNINRKLYNLESNLTCCNLQIIVCKQNTSEDCINIKRPSVKVEDSDAKIEIDFNFTEGSDAKIETDLNLTEDSDAKIETDLNLTTFEIVNLKTDKSGLKDEMQADDNLSETDDCKPSNVDSDNKIYLNLSEESNASNEPKEVLEDYATAVNLTADNAREEIKLRKKKNNYKCDLEPSDTDSDSNIETLDTVSDSPVKSKETKLSNEAKEVLEDYLTAVILTADEAKKEIQLRKETYNYKCNPYKCELCFKGFNVKTTFDNHMKRHSPECGTFECEYCHLRLNKIMAHKSRCFKWKYTCKTCPFFTYSRTKATDHMHSHQGKKFDCNECGLTFSTASTVASHKSKMHNKEVACALCGSSFRSLNGLLVHQSALHINEDKTELSGPECKECDVRFATETAYKRHMVSCSKHTVSNGCKCCGEIFTNEEDLSIHLKLHFRSQKKSLYLPVACQICDEWLTSSSKYKDHMTKHSKSDVNKMKKNESPKSLVCEFCGKVFKHRCLLREHIGKHMGRTYECKECGKVFTQPSSLYAHKRSIHSAIKNVFTCDLCKKEYAKKDALSNHIKRNHLNLKPYKCQLCDTAFIHKCDVKNHMDHVHFKKPWPKRDRTNKKLKETK